MVLQRERAQNREEDCDARKRRAVRGFRSNRGMVRVLASASCAARRACSLPLRLGLVPSGRAFCLLSQLSRVLFSLSRPNSARQCFQTPDSLPTAFSSCRCVVHISQICEWGICSPPDSTARLSWVP